MTCDGVRITLTLSRIRCSYGVYAAVLCSDLSIVRRIGSPTNQWPRFIRERAGCVYLITTKARMLETEAQSNT